MRTATATKSKAAAPLAAGISLSAGDLTTPKTAGGDQWVVLGAMRFVLAIVVMIGHLDMFDQVPPALRFISNFGAYQAVFVFFAISGYSISASLERSTKGFYQRRVNRIYPTFLFGMVVAVIPFLLFGPEFDAQSYYVRAPESAWAFVANCLMLQGIAMRGTIPTFNPCWSLQVECVAYLCAPMLCKMKDRVLVAIMAISFLAYIGRGVFGDLQDPPTSMYGIATIECIWAWIAGVLIYRHMGSEKVAWSITALIAWAMGSLTKFASDFSPAYLIGAMGIVTHAPMIRVPERLRKLALYGGDLSLSIYLIHFQIYCLVARAFPNANGWEMLACATLASFAVLHLIDRPYTAYAKRASAKHPEQLSAVT